MTQNYSLALLGQYINVSTTTATFTGNVSFANGIFLANNASGTAAQVLTSNSVGGIYWSTTVGYTGSQGTTGFTGSQGTSGSTGYTGSQGIQGTTGFTGSVGFVGSQGTQGSIGYTGSQGIQGTTGYTGSVGFTGSIGVGYTGSSGSGGGTSVTLSANNTDNNTYFFPMASSANLSAGLLTTGVVSNTYLYFVPATGTLNSQIFNSLSDVNKKTNIQTITNPIQIVNQLRGVSFDWKDNSYPSYGLIAQEVEQVIPAIVSTNYDGTKTLNYDALIGFLIEAIKQLSNQLPDKE